MDVVPSQDAGGRQKSQRVTRRYANWHSSKFVQLASSDMLRQFSFSSSLASEWFLHSSSPPEFFALRYIGLFRPCHNRLYNLLVFLNNLDMPFTKINYYYVTKLTICLETPCPFHGQPFFDALSGQPRLWLRWSLFNYCRTPPWLSGTRNWVSIKAAMEFPQLKFPIA